MTDCAIRYIVDDVEAAIDFYTRQLEFVVEMHPAPGFAKLSRGSLTLLINQPGAGGAGQAVGGEDPAPGGWNRIQLPVDDLDRRLSELKNADVAFRGEVVEGNGGRQLLIEDPAGNPIELFEPNE